MRGKFWGAESSRWSNFLVEENFLILFRAWFNGVASFGL
jgi:hypothetical protein